MIGEQFGNYRSLALLGEGGMGAVYLAEHPGIGRRVAVKVLHKNYTRDEHLLARFLNEARAANAIRHPNIIEILDSGMLADGTPFLVMELLEGESLGTRLRQNGALPIATRGRLRVPDRVGAGRRARQGDRPPRSQARQPLRRSRSARHAPRARSRCSTSASRSCSRDRSADSVKTRTGTLMGTPIYMSPEQCRGTRAVDHRSDIYSLGVIFYEMLVGQPPFVSEGFGDLVNMHLNVPPASARSKRAEIPLAVDALVLKMLAKNPEDRYANMTEVQGALKASGGSQFTVRGSSPDLGKPHGKPPVTQTSPMGDTTFSTGSGERIVPEMAMGGGGGRGKKLFMGVVAAAAIGGGGIWWLSSEAPKPATKIAVAPAPVRPTPPITPPPVTPTPTPVHPVVAQAKKVEVRLASVPAGAKVVDNVDGQLLGLTPLVLTRPRGGTLTLRFEKDGYSASTRTMALDGDRAFELTLEQKPKKRERKPREPSNEPAKL